MKFLYCIKIEKYAEFKTPNFHAFVMKNCFFLLFVINEVAITIKHFKKKNLNDKNNINKQNISSQM